jgi:1,4-alpha-glucan branching enzyme
MLGFALLIAACPGHGAGDAGGSLADAGSDAGSTGDAGGLLDAGPFGPTFTDGGVTFRVWAPNAQSVSVEGGFGSQPLEPLGDGTFQGTAAGAQPMQQYQYEIESGGVRLTRTDPRAQLVGADPGGKEPVGILYSPAGYAWSSFTPPMVSQAVIYELHVATFVDPTGTGAGTYVSAATKLADLAQLGINVVELMPVAEFPGSYSWGYNPVYPSAPCRAYGSPGDLQAFIDQAHQLGIAVILDVVFNHFGLDSETTPSLSMWCFDGPCDGGGIYFFPETATPFGPRPAFGVLEVHDLILDALASWLSSYDVDGFRWDSVVYTRSVTPGGANLPEGARLIKDANVAVHAQNPNAITIGEDLAGWNAITEPVDPAQINVYDSGYGFDGQWDDGFYYALEPLLVASSDAQRDVTTLVQPLTGGPALQNVVYTEDHDKVAPQNGPDNQRIPALIGMTDNGYWAERRSGLGLAVVLTAPAIPMLFMGQEFLTTLPFPFSPAPAIDWTNEQTYSGFRQLVHDLIALRRNTAGETAGLSGASVQLIAAANSHGGEVAPAIAYHRWDQGGPGDDTVVAANFSNVQLSLPIGFPQPGVWHVRFNSDDQIYSPAFGNTPSADVTTQAVALDGLPQSGSAALGPYSVVIYSQ